jgi:hypothetical protein
MALVRILKGPVNSGFWQAVPTVMLVLQQVSL